VIFVKVAALYDIHANLPALEAVLVEVMEAQPDRIVIGGDITWGPMPRQTLQQLTELGNNAVFIRGNADREVADPEHAHLEGWAADVNEWCAKELSTQQRDFLRDLPMSVTFDLEACGSTLFFHATPRRDDEVFTATTPSEKLIPLFSGYLQSTFVCGHTHMQFDRMVGDKRIINAGSVGMPYSHKPGAYWALFGDDVQLRRTEYDYDAAAEAIANTGCPEAIDIAAEIKSPPSPDEALATFEGMSG
jgi:putative phosphoesterase